MKLRRTGWRALEFANNIFSSTLEKMAAPAVAPLGAKAGGADRIRTGGLMNATHALYQLSYSPTTIFSIESRIKSLSFYSSRHFLVKSSR